MEKVREVMQSMGVLPKLHLGVRQEVSGEKDKSGNPKMVIVATGPHRVKFLSEPVGVTKKDFDGKPQKMLRFEVESEGVKYHWYAKVLNKEGEPNYLLESLADVKIGDERFLEMKKRGARNYVEVREVDAPPTIDIDETEDDEEEPAEKINYPKEEDGDIDPSLIPF